MWMTLVSLDARQSCRMPFEDVSSRGRSHRHHSPVRPLKHHVVWVAPNARSPPVRCPARCRSRVPNSTLRGGRARLYVLGYVGRQEKAPGEPRTRRGLCRLMSNGQAMSSSGTCGAVRGRYCCYLYHDGNPPRDIQMARTSGSTLDPVARSRRRAIGNSPQILRCQRPHP